MVYIGAKLLAPFLADSIQSFFFGSKKKKNSDINFDHLIEQKKAYLRGDVRVDPMGQASSNQGDTPLYNQKLHEEFNQLSSIKSKTDVQKKN